jgi:hypothetical protein
MVHTSVELTRNNDEIYFNLYHSSTEPWDNSTCNEPRFTPQEYKELLDSLRLNIPYRKNGPNSNYIIAENTTEGVNLEITGRKFERIPLCQLEKALQTESLKEELILNQRTQTHLPEILDFISKNP